MINKALKREKLLSILLRKKIKINTNNEFLSVRLLKFKIYMDDLYIVQNKYLVKKSHLI